VLGVNDFLNTIELRIVEVLEELGLTILRSGTEPMDSFEIRLG
jgi:hypothetical protein